jgi:hypothetical protein
VWGSREKIGDQLRARLAELSRRGPHVEGRDRAGAVPGGGPALGNLSSASQRTRRFYIHSFMCASMHHTSMDAAWPFDNRVDQDLTSAIFRGHERLCEGFFFLFPLFSVIFNLLVILEQF